MATCLYSIVCVSYDAAVNYRASGLNHRAITLLPMLSVETGVGRMGMSNPTVEE